MSATWPMSPLTATTARHPMKSGPVSANGTSFPPDGLVFWKCRYFIILCRLCLIKGRTHPKYFFRPRAFSLVENDFNQMGPEVQYRLDFLWKRKPTSTHPPPTSTKMAEPLNHYTTIPPYHHTTIPLYHHTTIPLYHYTTIPLNHYTTIPPYH